MIVVHFGLVMGSDQTRPAYAAEIMHLFDGRAAALFVVLAGVGLTLRSNSALTSGSSQAMSQVQNTLIRRGLFLLAIGFVNLLIWQGDILRVYGVSLVLAAGLIAAPDRRLLLIALAFVLAFVLLLLLFDYGQNWEWSTMTYHRLWTPSGVVRNLFYDGFRSVFPWSGLLIFGMWLGRQDLRNRERNTRILWAAVGVVVGAELVSWLLVAYFRAHPHRLDAETIKARVRHGVDAAVAPVFDVQRGGGCRRHRAGRSRCRRVAERAVARTAGRDGANGADVVFCSHHHWARYS